ncbi:unnamed protein product [Allacma fusca]|uniref:Uncharacterized protein n=1 Tax=Allacma fusca TaxID=39272 RepID=A0A8J2K6X6_9HEXA|nr:unnamed protein product [Allacma fusca]
MVRVNKRKWVTKRICVTNAGGASRTHLIKSLKNGSVTKIPICQKKQPPSPDSEDEGVRELLVQVTPSQVPQVSDYLIKGPKRRKSPPEDVVLNKLTKLIELQSSQDEQSKTSAFFQYLEAEMKDFASDDEEDFKDACVDKLREIKKRRKQKKHEKNDQSYHFELIV